MEESFQSFRYNPMELISMIITVFIFCVGIPGNLFVIYVFGWKKRKRRNRYRSGRGRGDYDRNTEPPSNYQNSSSTRRFEFLLFLLGCIDLVSLLLIPPVFFYLIMTKFKVWHLGKIACKLVPSLLQITVSVSQGMLVLICYERYSAIVYPFDHNKTEGISTFRIFAWLCNVVFISVVFIYPYVYSFDLRPGKFGPICEPAGERRWNYLFASACLQVTRDLASALTMAVLSYRMNKALVRPPSNHDIKSIAATTKRMSTVSAMTTTPTLTTSTMASLETTQNLATSSTMMKTRRKISTVPLKTPTLATSKIASNTTKTRSETFTTSTLTTSTASWDRARMSAKSRKVIKTVVVVFTILYLPVDLFHLLYYSLIKAGVPIVPVIESVILPVNTMLNIMQISNSVANIFIYSKMHVFFRKMVLAPMRIRKISLGPGRKMSFQDSIRKVGERRATKKVRSKSFH